MENNELNCKRKSDFTTETEKQAYNSGWIEGYAKALEAKGVKPINRQEYYEDKIIGSFDSESDGYAEIEDLLHSAYSYGFNKGYDEGAFCGYEDGFCKGNFSRIEEVEGFEEGYEKGLAEGSSYIEDSYIAGYKACLFKEPPMVEDEELRELLEQDGDYEEDIPIGDLYVSGDILRALESLKKDLHSVRSRSFNTGINEIDKRELSFKMLNIIKKLGDVQHSIVRDALHRYLGYID